MKFKGVPLLGGGCGYWGSRKIGAFVKNARAELVINSALAVLINRVATLYEIKWEHSSASNEREFVGERYKCRKQPMPVLVGGACASASALKVFLPG